jgi:hypothetical protein
MNRAAPGEQERCVVFDQLRKSLKGKASVLRWLQVVAVANLFILVAWAQQGPGFNTTVPSQIMDQFRNQRLQWTTNVFVYPDLCTAMSLRLRAEAQ